MGGGGGLRGSGDRGEGVRGEGEVSLRVWGGGGGVKGVGSYVCASGFRG